MLWLVHGEIDQTPWQGACTSVDMTNKKVCSMTPSHRATKKSPLD